MDNEIIKYLNEKNISFIEHSHPPVFTVAQSNLLIKKKMGRHTKSLFLIDDLGKFYLATICAEKRLDIPKIRKILSVKKLQFGKTEDLRNILKVNPGSVSLLGAIYSKDLNLILDKDIIESESSGFHPNDNKSTLELTKENLSKFISSLPNKKRVIEI